MAHFGLGRDSAAPRGAPRRSEVSTVGAASEFLSHDESIVDPVNLHTRGTTNGYTGGPVHRPRGHSYAASGGIYLDEAESRRRPPSQPPQYHARGKMPMEQSVVDELGDFYTGATNRKMEKRPDAIKRMDERYMSDEDKRKKMALMQRQFQEGQSNYTTQLDEQAQKRAQDRDHERSRAQEYNAHDPWEKDLYNARPHNGLSQEITNPKDYGRVQDIAPPGMLPRDVVKDDPYRNYDNRHHIIKPHHQPEDGGTYFDGEFGKGVVHDDSSDFRRRAVEPIIMNHQQAVQQRFKEAAVGSYEAVEAKGRVHHLTKNTHYNEADVMGPTMHEYNNEAAQRRRKDFVDQEYTHSNYDPNNPHQDFGGHFGAPEDAGKDRRLRHYKEQDSGHYGSQ